MERLERLTSRNEDCVSVNGHGLYHLTMTEVVQMADRLAAYEDTGLTPEEIKAPFTEDTMINLAAQALGVEPSRLRELTEADKDGRVVVLPCKVGDTVWIVGAVRKLYSAKVRTFFCGHPSAVRGRDPDGHIHMIRTTECDIPMQEFGKTVFLSREEAEKTLREIQGKEDADGATDKPE